jgi:hypothetical protein
MPAKIEGLSDELVKIIHGFVKDEYRYAKKTLGKKKNGEDKVGARFGSIQKNPWIIDYSGGGYDKTINSVARQLAAKERKTNKEITADNVLPFTKLIGKLTESHKYKADVEPHYATVFDALHKTLPELNAKRFSTELKQIKALKKIAGQTVTTSDIAKAWNLHKVGGSYIEPGSNMVTQLPLPLNQIKNPAISDGTL